MMRNAEFETELVKRLEEHYGADYEIQIRDVTKLSQEPLRGLTIKRKEENIAPIIYLDYLAGMNMNPLRIGKLQRREFMRDLSVLMIIF